MPWKLLSRFSNHCKGAGCAPFSAIGNNTCSMITASGSARVRRAVIGAGVTLGLTDERGTANGNHNRMRSNLPAQESGPHGRELLLSW